MQNALVVHFHCVVVILVSNLVAGSSVLMRVCCMAAPPPSSKASLANNASYEWELIIRVAEVGLIYT